MIAGSRARVCGEVLNTQAPYVNHGVVTPKHGTSLQRLLQRSAHREGLSAVPNWVLR
jgi:hypothetical protein